MDAPGFIVHSVIGRKIHFGLTPQDLGVIWRHYAYWLGPYALRDLLADFRESGRTDYSYLYDGSQKPQDMSLDRLWLHQALRALLLTSQDMRKLFHLLVTLPQTPPRKELSEALCDLLLTPDLWYDAGAEPEPHDSQAA